MPKYVYGQSDHHIGANRILCTPRNEELSHVRGHVLQTSLCLHCTVVNVEQCLLYLNGLIGVSDQHPTKSLIINRSFTSGLECQCYVYRTQASYRRIHNYFSTVHPCPSIIFPMFLKDTDGPTFVLIMDYFFRGVLTCENIIK